MNLLAIGWEPELRGLLTVIISVVILMGSIYMIMATNMGSRLAFLVAITGLAGWMMLMGATWWIYGIGLRGPDPSWQPVPGQTVLQDTEALRSAGILEEPLAVPDDATFVEEAALVSDVLLDEGYVLLDPASPAFGQAQASASVYLEESGAFATGEYAITDIFDIGGERYPRIAGRDELDFFAFWHEPHYVVVEAAPYVQVRVEDGRAPVSPTIDDTRQRQYVYMVRDLGARRQPAVVLTIGGGAIFLSLCYLLHRRERILNENLANAKAVATA
ncbi:hypothetical protein [Ilumatobacter coccineus]|jgi:hypothetical protein|uniref:Uncharacterized protein n=1 Tax=Ilumatobacter coccineus (strain NBRC 103263 / KCTC 29153 / YM16-304) TaxID=1313172 RepID=A0A6C7E614_ILUCY|nr:hypothetical protein [Ilumatobacter coccineus]BAN00719.1 hypothetical protein YM304_04050 [Ilumatobacter coccineus YM16-304]